MSLRMLDAAGISPLDSIVDIGGGASPFAEALLSRGFSDITVLDVWAAGMKYAQARLGAQADRVRWLIADVCEWRPGRVYRAWHDRAAFVFLTVPSDKDEYLRAVTAATAVDSVAVIGCFAPDGPRMCSGLPVARYSPQDVADQLGPGWELISGDREEHTTPTGALQPFSWSALRRTS